MLMQVQKFRCLDFICEQCFDCECLPNIKITSFSPEKNNNNKGQPWGPIPQNCSPLPDFMLTWLCNALMQDAFIALPGLYIITL